MANILIVLFILWLVGFIIIPTGSNLLNFLLILALIIFLVKNINKKD